MRQNQQIQQLFIQFINYLPYLLHVSALHCNSSGGVPSAFWEMLNWGAVDRILWMGVLCLVTWWHNTPFHNILSIAPQLSISQKALETLPEDGSVMPKHVGDTIHN
jgi:hypothetical protein